MVAGNVDAVDIDDDAFAVGAELAQLLAQFPGHLGIGAHAGGVDGDALDRGIAAGAFDQRQKLD